MRKGRKIIGGLVETCKFLNLEIAVLTKSKNVLALPSILYSKPRKH